MISAEPWRLYAATVDRAHRDGKLRPFDATTSRLATVLNTSPATARRCLAELETTGLLEVTDRPGGWLSIRVILDEQEAAETADAGQNHTATPPR